jgi:hypothetical protein
VVVHQLQRVLEALAALVFQVVVVVLAEIQAVQVA